jgi:hypothetical protein
VIAIWAKSGKSTKYSHFSKVLQSTGFKNSENDMAKIKEYMAAKGYDRPIPNIEGMIKKAHS